MSQSDKGEMVIGGGADGYNNYTQRGSFHHIEETVRALVETFPSDTARVVLVAEAATFWRSHQIAAVVRAVAAIDEVRCVWYGRHRVVVHHKMSPSSAPQEIHFCHKMSQFKFLTVASSLLKTKQRINIAINKYK